MKHFTLKPFFAAALLLTALSASAQEYITPSPAGGFDLSKGKDYVVIYAPAEAIQKMGDKILSNQNLDASQEKNSFLYWTYEWDEKDLTMLNIEEEGLTNPYGGTDFQNMTPIWNYDISAKKNVFAYTWAAGQFVAKTGNSYDLSMIDESYILHLDLRDGGKATSQYKINIGNNDQDARKNDLGSHIDLMVNLDKGDAVGDYAGVGSMPHDGNWYCLDIPVKDLFDEEGDYGFSKKNWNNISAVFTVGFNNPECTKVKSKALLPGDAVYTYELDEVQAALTLGSVYFYKANDAAVNGINEVATSDADSVEAIYDLSGRKTDMTRPGIYLVKTAKGTKKVIKK